MCESLSHFSKHFESLYDTLGLVHKTIKKSGGYMQANYLMHNIAIKKVLRESNTYGVELKHLATQLGKQNPHTNWTYKSVWSGLQELKCSVNNLVEDLGEKSPY